MNMHTAGARLILGIAFLAVSFMGVKTDGEEVLDCSHFLKQLIDLDRLPYLEEGVSCDQSSSYDRRSRYDAAAGKYVDWSANADSGHYIRIEPETKEAIMAKMKGPGCINRIWSANPQGKIRFYLDGDEKPTYEFDFNKLFSGKIEPFRSPLVWQRRVALGGDNPASDCYFPIPYAKSCKVTADKPHRQYYHIAYTTYPKSAVVKSFHLPLTDQEKEVLSDVCARMSDCGWDPQPKQLFYVRKLMELKPGQALTLDEIEGSAVICSLRANVTTAAERWPQRKVILRAYWDGEEKPSIWSPIGDFFGEGFSNRPYRSLPLGMEKGSYYCFWRMPFRKSARFVVVSEAKRPLILALDVGFQKVESLPPNTAYFHAKWRRERDCASFDYPFLECEGRGRFVGVALFVDNLHGGWWGEGDEKIYVDGEKFPSFFGTGSEDYFGDAWGIRHFVNPYHGCPLTMDSKQSCYRWHITDSVPFQKSFKITIESYAALEKVHNDYSSMAYWYQMASSKDFFKEVGVRERLPAAKSFSSDAIEVEKLFVPGELPAGASIVNDVDLPSDLSAGAGVKFAGKDGASLTLPIPVERRDNYSIDVGTPPDIPAASFDLMANGKPIGDKLLMNKGRNNITLKFTAPAEGKENCEVILDYIRLAPYKNYIRNWMVVGPWDNPNNQGLFKEYPPEKEINFEKSYDGKSKKVKWKEAKADARGVIDLVQLLSPNENTIAYGYCQVNSPEEVKTDMYVGSDDGVRVWLNGKLIHDNHVSRGYRADEDTVEVRLQKGANKLLVKIDQGGGGWQFSVRFRDPEDKLSYSLR